MPGESAQSPLPTVTPPRLLSPAKSRLQSRGNSLPEDAGNRSPFVPTPDAPRPPTDEFSERDPVFLTDISLREIDTINETGEDTDQPDARKHRSEDGEEDDEEVGSQIESDTESVEIDADYDTDLEMETDKWLNPELYDHDTTGVNRYLRMCQKLEIQPITYFLKHMQDKELVMKYHGLGPLGMKAMADPLEVNTSIEKMDLEGNYMLGIGAKYLANVLKDNVYVTELTLSENKIGNMGAKAVCDLLMENKTITYLDLRGNNIEDAAADDFYNMLSSNVDLRTLILRHNCFEDEGARTLKDALADNDTLTTLDLSWNHFQWRGCCQIAEGMAENTAIKYLNLCMNGFGYKGSEALEEMLKENHTLLELDISFCQIPLSGAPHIASGIQNNDTLQKLNIGYNQIQDEGGYVILLGEERNENGPMKYIDFGNLTVKPKFETLAVSLKENRNMTIRYGGVMLDVTSFKSAKQDLWAAHVNDPMTKLTEWLDKAGYRLVDLLLTFDRDGSLNLDLEELKAGIHGAGIDMTDLEIELLMMKLDDDNSGTIDMKELMHGNELNILEAREAQRFMEDKKKDDAERRKLSKAGDAKDFHKLIKEADTVRPIAMV
ncbi:leucine-rich repeat-containing protein 74B-like [Dreissena polymorpha]|nr:leucine-rich repeat-containing protein 74B-like [Dreissena polymorpha]